MRGEVSGADDQDQAPNRRQPLASRGLVGGEVGEKAGRDPVRLRFRRGGRPHAPRPRCRTIDCPAASRLRLSKGRGTEGCAFFFAGGSSETSSCAIRTISLAISSGERTKSIYPLAIALPGMSGLPAVSSLCAMVMPPTSFNVVQCGCPISIIAGDNHGDKPAVPVPRQGAQKNRDNVGPSSRLR